MLLSILTRSKSASRSGDAEQQQQHDEHDLHAHEHARDDAADEEAEAGEAEAEAGEAEPEPEPQTTHLNRSLETLCEVFPGGDIEDIRRLLATTEEESRLYVVTEMLLKKRTVSSAADTARRGNGKTRLQPWEKFRTEAYRGAVQKALSKEFRGLSKSAIQAVLAEHNFQYGRSRETLATIAARSWRVSFSNFFRRSPRSSASPLDPHIASTGSKELDAEIFELGRPAREAQVLSDRNVAVRINEEEHAAAQALLECECCFGDYAWEETVACMAGHFFCHTCLRRSVQESVFGQGKSLVPEKNSVRCLSSTALPPCDEFVPADILRAVLPEDVYHSLEDRTASASIEKSGLKLIRCPFCGYAEADELPPHRVKASAILLLFLVASLVLTLLSRLPASLSLLLLITLTSPLHTFPAAVRARLDAALRAVALRRRGTLFKCANSARCARESCIVCAKEWQPFHKCYEKEEDAARIYVERAMADAVKRTCPLCNVSFVKSDGCNKLACPCGYVMCYICRADIRTVGYKHFCQHFRQVPGTACGDCNDCDLYANEDEALIIHRAAKTAELEYLELTGRSWSGTVAETRVLGWGYGSCARCVEWWEWVVEGVVEGGVEWV
ncbi:hypothetical protein BZA05DRAFT_476551 [Tricharina praecox]|uniref:uncharacterized protein n=1 Tax=Tricharina praecox TaxID=43433 RepID=UPI00221F96B5|nr:uncharacterized protein BZA05DRAFT_476551 [Tricharina praecox]KAI5845383.1 hypothetical protein BZA05DRAFT_476551 [Tricharina praecox]